MGTHPSLISLLLLQQKVCQGHHSGWAVLFLAVGSDFPLQNPHGAVCRLPQVHGVCAGDTNNSPDIVSGRPYLNTGSRFLDTQGVFGLDSLHH